MGWYSWRRYYFCKGRRFISNDEESFSIHSGDGFYHLPWARHGVRPVNVDNARFLLRLPRPARTEDIRPNGKAVSYMIENSARTPEY